MTALELPIPERIKRRHRRREDLSVSEWAVRHRVVTEGPLVTGAGQGIPWSNDVFPPGVAIMDSATDERFRRTIMLAAPQSSGKTAVVINVLLHAVDWQRRDVMYVHANSLRGEELYAKKIAPAITASERLRELIPQSRDEIGTKGAHRFTGGQTFFVTGSESEGDLSGATVPVIAFDDVHAMPPSLGAHGHAVEFAEKRSAAYPPGERVSIIAGQASDVENWLWRALLNSAFYILYVPCLECGTYQMLDFERMQFDSSSPEAAARDCWLRCANEKCTHEIRHEELPAMLADHAWVSTPPDCNPVLDPGARTGLASLADEAVFPETARPTQDAGFWWNALSWPLVPWTQHAADHVSALGQPDSMRSFRQQVQVIPWEEPRLDEEALEESDVRALAVAEHHWKTIPPEAGVHTGEGVLIITCDVQAGYVWYLVFAWNLKTGSCWLIECGRFGEQPDTKEHPSKAQRKQLWKSRVVRALDDLWAKESGGWEVTGYELPVTGDEEAEKLSAVSGQPNRTRSVSEGVDPAVVHATHCLIDIGFLRETVQTSCRRFNGSRAVQKWLPVEGSQCKARGKVPVWPGLTKPTVEKRTRRRYWECNTNRAKLLVREIVAIPPGHHGALRLPPDMPDYLRDTYPKHLCAEEWDKERGVWVKTGKENHLLDCTALQVIGALACNVRLPSIEAEAQPEVVTDWFSRQKRRSRQPSAVSQKRS